MTWRIYSVRDFAGELADEWQQLNARHYGAHPLLDLRFVQPLLATFAEETTIFAAYRQDGRSKAALFLDSDGAGRWRTFDPSQATMGLVMFESRDARPYLSGLFQALAKPTLNVALMKQDGAFAPELPSDEMAEERLDIGLTTNIVLSGGFSDYWAARSKKLQSSLRRSLKRVDQDRISLELRVVEDPAQLRDALKTYGEIETSGWKGREGTSIQIDNQQGRFYLDLMQRFGHDREASIYQLCFSGEPVSSLICVSSNGMQVVLKTTYRQEFSQYGPGRLMDYFMLEHEFAHLRHQVVENYTNASVADLRWATGSRHMFNVNMYPSALAKTLVHTGRGLQRSPLFGWAGGLKKWLE